MADGGANIFEQIYEGGSSSLGINDQIMPRAGEFYKYIFQ